MANPYFQFKKFTVWHDRCAMKVGTDGVLLGAWVDLENHRRILDVGTGTGLIALMLAQRGDSFIDAIDIDADACLQAKSNIAKSPFAQRIKTHHASLSAFAREKREARYDLIVSNPPYYTNASRCPNDQRDLARRTASLSISELLKDSRKLLTEEGQIAVILPFDQRETFFAYAKSESLYLYREAYVSSIEGNTPKRILVTLSAIPVEKTLFSTFAIETKEHKYTETFIKLVKDFYLKM